MTSTRDRRACRISHEELHRGHNIGRRPRNQTSGREPVKKYAYWFVRIAGANIRIWKLHRMGVIDDAFRMMEHEDGGEFGLSLIIACKRCLARGACSCPIGIGNLSSRFQARHRSIVSELLFSHAKISLSATLPNTQCWIRLI